MVTSSGRSAQDFWKRSRVLSRSGSILTMPESESVKSQSLRGIAAATPCDDNRFHPW